MGWELFDEHSEARGKYGRYKMKVIKEYGYLTASGGMKVRWTSDFDGLQTTRIVACKNMDQEEIDKAMEEFRQIHPFQKSHESDRIIAERREEERKTQEYFREKAEEEERKRKYLAEKKAKEEAEKAFLESQKEKFKDIK